MSSAYLKVHARFTAMLVTAVILAPAAIATPAVQDLVDLRAVINAAATTIGDPNNSNKGFGIGLFSGGSNQMGTADLVNNITTTILRSKFQLDTNKACFHTRYIPKTVLTDMEQTSWLFPDNITNTPSTPTLPLSSSLILPSILPTTTPTLDNITTDLSAPYIDYISSIPNLSTGLTTLGRAYHKEMNAPIRVAIDALQQSISAFQSTLLQSDLVRSQAVIRTIRASSSLEDAQQAWNRFLNLPGRVSGSGTDTGGTVESSPGGRQKRSWISTRPPPADGRFYTHKELWGRTEPRARQLQEGKPDFYDAVVMWERERGTAENARVGRPYVA